MLLAGLFLVTAYYAMQTRRIANDTHELAGEVGLQRLHDFVPIMDIIADPTDIELISIGLKRDKGEVPENISCRLTNVGRGPAFHCAFLAVHSHDQVARLVEPTLLVGQVLNNVLGPQSNHNPNERSRLSLKVETAPQGSSFVKVTYQDVFGHRWSSTKSVPKSRHADLRGPLCFERTEVDS